MTVRSDDPTNHPAPGRIPVKVADWVSMAPTPTVIGSVKRVACDGAWANVEWSHPSMGTWTKRQECARLIVHHTIPHPHPDGGAGTVTDMNRMAEIKAILAQDQAVTQ